MLCEIVSFRMWENQKGVHEMQYLLNFKNNLVMSATAMGLSSDSSSPQFVDPYSDLPRRMRVGVRGFGTACCG